jgi:hypothetical protein
MTTTLSSTEKKSTNSSDEICTFDKDKLELTTFKNGSTIGRATFEPAWSWDKCVKPIVKTNSCEAPHTLYMVSGRIKIVMDKGIEEEFGPGDTAAIPPGLNAWVIGDQSVIAIDFNWMSQQHAKEIQKWLFVLSLSIIYGHIQYKHYFPD